MLCLAGTVRADSAAAGWWSLTAENNNFVVDEDRHYVNGVNLAYLSAPLSMDQGWAARVSTNIESALRPLFPHAGQADEQRFEWTVLGQQLFTPANKSLSVPDPQDRPYAAWLYTGFNLLQERDHRALESLSASIGVVGPWALGDEVQNTFHKAFGFGLAEGWSHQLRNEPALDVSYLRKWRLALRDPASDGLNADVVPELGATAGNVLTYGEATVLLRAGWGLESAFGPHLIQPGISGAGYFDPAAIRRNWSVNIFAGFQERAVAHNIFLDGNSFERSPSIGKYVWVHDQAVGFSAMGWRSLRVDFTYVRRSEEFHGQNGHDSYGSITAAWQW
jgi:hypothetical protein